MQINSMPSRVDSARLVEIDSFARDIEARMPVFFKTSVHTESREEQILVDGRNGWVKGRFSRLGRSEART